MLRPFIFGLVLLIGAGATNAAEAHSNNSAAEADIRKFQVGAGFKVELVAAEPLLQNPVCFSIDERGRFYVVETHRYRNAIFDITANTPWLLDDLSLRTVNDRAAFLGRKFATNFAVLTNDSEVIRLVEDRDGDGRAETASIFADGFNKPIAGTAAGVLAQGTNVWFTCIPDLWRLSDSGLRVSRFESSVPATATRNSKPETRDTLVTGLGVHISVSGHDVHGLIRGHDGRIYFSFGDRGVCVTNREGAVLNVPDTGGVLRCEADGRNMEIFCIGLRNPQELAFDDFGNLWTVDNDTAGADPCRVLHLIEGGDYGWRASYQHMKGFGPWVQEELWRGGLDGVLPPAGTVSQGPAGLAFHPGTGSPQLAGKFVHADFPGGVWAYNVKPRGASYEVAGKEKILWNCWPTDVDFGPDGALYVLDWVQGWTPPGKGRIYRITASAELGTRNAEMVADVKRLLGEGMTERSEKELLVLLGHKDRRVRLEAQWELADRGLPGLVALNENAKEGESRTQRLHALWAIGQIARSISEYSSPKEIEMAIFSLLHLTGDKDRLVAAQAARALAEAKSYEGMEAMTPLLSESDAAVRLIAGQALAMMPFGRGVRTQPRAADKLARQINKPWAHRAAAWFLARHWGWVGPLENAGSLLKDQDHDPFLQHVARLVLQQGVTMGSFYDDRLRQACTNKSEAIRLSALRAHRRLAERALGMPVWPGFPNFQTNAAAIATQLTDFLTASNPRLVLEAARAINDVPIPDAYPVLAALLRDPRFRDPNWGWSALSNITPAGPFTAKVRPPREQVLFRALNAHYRLGDATNAGALVRFAMGDNLSPIADVQRPRAEALFLLGAWEVLPAKVGDLPIKPARDPNHGSVPTINPENWPGWFDRVVGLYRPLPPRPAEDARRALTPRIEELVADAAPEVAQAALDAAVKLRLTNAAPALMARLRNAATPASVRRQVPSALASMGCGELAEAVKLALADRDSEVRAAALPHLGFLQGDDAAGILGRMVTAGVSSTNATAGDLRLAQAALTALGGLEASAATVILRAALTNLLAGTLPSALELDLLEASGRKTNPEIKALLAQQQATHPKNDPLTGWRSVLQGGDAERGRTIFFEKVEVQCSRCHVVKGQGGIAGPALDGVGNRQTREHLLESILFPSRAIASGFENVTVTLKSGATHAGLVKGEDDKELRLESPEDGPLHLVKNDIVSRQRGLSAMPEGLSELLSKRELRDLVEFVAQLK